MLQEAIGRKRKDEQRQRKLAMEAGLERRGPAGARRGPRARGLGPDGGRRRECAAGAGQELGKPGELLLPKPLRRNG